MAVKLKYTGEEINHLLDVAKQMEGTPKVEVDDALSVSSTNPVENKVVTEAVNNNATKIKELDNKIGKLTFNWIDVP